MGFFATTLSICDPIGYLQKRFLNRGFLETGPFEFSFSYWSGLSYDEFLKLRIYGIEIWTLLSPAVWITVVSNFQEALDGIRKDIPRMFDSMRQPRILPDEMLTHLSPIDFNSIQNVIVNSIWYTSQTPWIVREIDKITSMCYFLIVISIFISAEFFVQDFLNSFQLGPQSWILIILLSSGTFVVISYMLIVRLVGLRFKAMITLLFLIEQVAIKIDREHFERRLQDIEQYLTNGHWSMARLWIEQLS